jgi:hypothetical protein
MRADAKKLGLGGWKVGLGFGLGLVDGKVGLGLRLGLVGGKFGLSFGIAGPQGQDCGKRREAFSNRWGH